MGQHQLMPEGTLINNTSPKADIDLLTKRDNEMRIS